MEYEHAFLAPILLTRGGMSPNKVPFPEDVTADLRARGARRVIGTINGEPFDLGLHVSKSAGHTFIAMGRGRMRSLNVEPGDLVEVEVSADPEPDNPDPGPELTAALDANEEAREVWDGFSPGMKRSVAWHVKSAKREATRRSRAEETARKLADGTHPALRGRRRG